MANHDAALDVDLRFGQIRRAQSQAVRLPQNLRQLGAVGPFVPPPPAGSQRTVVKGWISNPHTTGDHLQYLQQGKGQQGQHAVLFGAAGPVDPQRFAQAAQDDTHQFRFSVSLKEAQPYFAFRPYIEALMAQVERDVRRPLAWVAAVHHDTAHPHAHVVLRGRDLEGTPLFFTKDYLSHGLRFRADRIATWLLGPDRSQAQQRAHTQARAKQVSLGHPAEQRRGQEMGL